VRSAGEKPEVRNEMLRVVSGCCPLTVYHFYYSGLGLCSSLDTWLQLVRRTVAYRWKSAVCLGLAELREKPELNLFERKGTCIA